LALTGPDGDTVETDDVSRKRSVPFAQRRREARLAAPKSPRADGNVSPWGRSPTVEDGGPVVLHVALSSAVSEPNGLAVCDAAGLVSRPAEGHAGVPVQAIDNAIADAGYELPVFQGQVSVGGGTTRGVGGSDTLTPVPTVAGVQYLAAARDSSAGAGVASQIG